MQAPRLSWKLGIDPLAAVRRIPGGNSGIKTQEMALQNENSRNTQKTKNQESLQAS
jgi:hypothetical protein